MIYSAIGRAVVKLTILWVRRRYSRQLKVAAGVALASVVAGAYLASRSVEEG